MWTVKMWTHHSGENLEDQDAVHTDSKDGTHVVSGRDKDPTGNRTTEATVSGEEFVHILPMS